MFVRCQYYVYPKLRSYERKTGFILKKKLDFSLTRLRCSVLNQTGEIVSKPGVREGGGSRVTTEEVKARK